MFICVHTAQWTFHLAQSALFMLILNAYAVVGEKISNCSLVTLTNRRDEAPGAVGRQRKPRPNFSSLPICRSGMQMKQKDRKGTN